LGSVVTEGSRASDIMSGIRDMAAVDLRQPRERRGD
jgi:hypothetical protein